ncbi:AraC family transcriptional regulator [Lactiplantibacillus daowaiensis]|uniref:AraC family ligand binding domain-containing protein n=1 Tax=Lactiplantibacillus daowaiensis TaxID=2559918 RepID=A0ABW1S092_9LACO|nr:AraC family transcriptional regulator [Lactiplantibacillus daowaiensis]
MEQAQAISLQLYADQPLSLSCAGISQTFPRHQYGPAVRSYYVIHYILKGRGTFIVDGVTYALHAGQGFLITPNVRTFYIADETDPWEYLWLGFGGQLASQIVQSLGLTQVEPIFAAQQFGPALRQATEDILAHPADDVVDNLARVGSLYQCFSKIAAANKEALATLIVNPYVNQAVAYIQQHIATPLTVTAIATAVGLDRSYLTAKFKQALGVTPGQYIKNFRLTMARHYLESSELSVAEIALKCGYQRPESLNKAFKQTYAVAPTIYRQRALW